MLSFSGPRAVALLIALFALGAYLTLPSRSAAPLPCCTAATSQPRPSNSVTRPPSPSFTGVPPSANTSSRRTAPALPSKPGPTLHPVTQAERVVAWNRTAANVNLQGYAAVTALLDKECAENSARRGPSVRGVLHGAAGVGPAAGWQRLWLVAVDAAGRPTCSGGDAFEVTVESADTRAVVDVVADLGRGLYELQVLLRRPGQFTVCSDVASRQINSRRDGSLVRAIVPGSWTANKTCTSFTNSISTAIADEVERQLAALRRRDPGCQRADALMRGEWRRVTRCTGRECAGDATAARSDGWVWVSDVCVVSYLPRGAAWRALRHEFLLAWGDSTLKQPLANMVEYGLGAPLLKNTFMATKAKKKPSFFDYRQYDVVPRDRRRGASFRLVYAWGGCESLSAVPDSCALKGVRNDRYVRSIAAKARHEMATAVAHNLTLKRSPWPTVIIANHYRIWASAPTPEEELINIANGIRMLHQTFVTKRPRNTRRPVLVWMSPVARQFEEHARAAPLHEGRAEAWAVESMLTKAFPYRPLGSQTDTDGTTPSVRIIGRYGMTNPLHHGSKHVHTGVHYGATIGMCMTGMGHRDFYELERCVRETWADDVLGHLWLNALPSHNDGSTSTATSTTSAPYRVRKN